MVGHWRVLDQINGGGQTIVAWSGDRPRALGRLGWFGFFVVLFLLSACSQLATQSVDQLSEREEPVVVVPTATTFVIDTSTAVSQTPLLSEAAVDVLPTNTPTIIATPIPSLTNTPSAIFTTMPTDTAVPKATFTPTATATVLPTPEPTVTQSPTATAVPITVNGVPVANFIKMSPEVIANSRAIFANGQVLGRDPHVFSKVGDSVTLTDHYLTRFDSGYYNLGDYAYLQPVIDHFAGSFERFGVAARIGLHAWSLFDPLWANKEWCQPNEDMIACEIRLNNPSILLIRLGSNDSAGGAYFEDNMRLLVEYAISQGIIPVLATKPDRFEGADNRNNLAILKLAEEYQLPLWDFDLVAETMPNKGLGGDLVHMTMADADDYTNPDTFERGYPMSDLTALMLLHAFYTEVIQTQ